MEIFLSWLIGSLLCGLIGAALGGTRNNRGAGFWWSFLLGPIGWIIALLLPPGEGGEKCRWCSRAVVKNKKRCACGKQYSDTGANLVARDPLAEWEAKQNQSMD